MNNIEELVARQELKQLVDNYATGTCYALAHLVNEVEGEDKLTVHGVRYYDKYVKINDKWFIAEREQYFVFSDTRAVEK